MVSIYRASDQQRYLLMHLAELDPGHYVGWGQLNELARSEMISNGRDHVIRSLREFPSRNGRDREKRLYLKDKPPLHKIYDLVRVVALTPTALELIPYGRGELQHNELREKRIPVGVSVSDNDFFAQLEEAFCGGNAATSAG